MNITLITAIGQQGQIGLNGKLPWHNPSDLTYFRNKTKNGVVICGYKTLMGLSHLYEQMPIQLDEDTVGFHGNNYRLFVLDHNGLTREKAIKIAENNGKDRVWIAGGARTYKRWVCYVDELDATSIDYNGPADTYFPFDSVKDVFMYDRTYDDDFPIEEELLKLAISCSIPAKTA